MTWTKSISQKFNWLYREDDFSVVNEDSSVTYKLFGVPVYTKTITADHVGNYKEEDNEVKKKGHITGFKNS